MTESLDIKCPKCSLPMRLARPKAASEVACPKCDHRIGLTAEGKITSAPRRDAFADLPAPAKLDVMPLRPKDFRPTKAPPPPPPPEPPKIAGTFHAKVDPLGAPVDPWKFWGKLVVPLICILITVGGGFAVYSYRDELGIGDLGVLASIAESMPMIDSHTKVIGEYTNVSDAASTVVRDLRNTDRPSDADVMKSAIRSLQQLGDKMKQLRRRAVALDPLTPDQWNALMTDMKERKETRAKTLKSDVESAPIQTPSRMAQSAAFRQAALDLMFAIGDTGSTIESAWKPIHEPGSPIEKMEHQVLMADRKIWTAVMQTEDESSYQSISRAHARAADDLESLLAEAQADPPAKRLFAPGSPYFSPALSLGSEIRLTLADLSEQYGQLDQRDAVDRYNDLRGRVDRLGRDSMATGGADDPGGSPFRPGRRGQNQQGQNQQGQNQQDPNQQDPNQPNQDQPSPNQQGRRVRTPGMDGRPSSGGVPPTVEQAIARTIKGIRSRTPVERTVLVRIEDRIDGPDGDQLIDKVKRTVAARGTSAYGFGDTGLVAFYGPMTVQHVAAAIDWGDVLSIDDSERMIHVRVKESAR